MHQPDSRDLERTLDRKKGKQQTFCILHRAGGKKLNTMWRGIYGSTRQKADRKNPQNNENFPQTN